MAKICTIKCPLCGNFMASLVTKRGAPFIYCGICRFGSMLLAKSGKDNFSNACQEIETSELPSATLEWYNKKIGEKNGASDKSVNTEKK